MKTKDAAPEIATEQPKEKETYKLTYGNFKSKNEAIKELVIIKKNFHASLIIDKNCYKILFGEYSKADAEKNLAIIKASGIKAELL